MAFAWHDISLVWHGVASQSRGGPVQTSGNAQDVGHAPPGESSVVLPPGSVPGQVSGGGSSICVAAASRVKARDMPYAAFPTARPGTLPTPAEGGMRHVPDSEQGGRGYDPVIPDDKCCWATAGIGGSKPRLSNGDMTGSRMN